jgi:hypothetical protein
MGGIIGMRKYMGLWIALSVVGAIGFSVLGVYGYINTTRNEGVRLEQTLSQEYADNQNELSNFISTFYEQVGLANRKSAVLDTILRNAVQGRYGDDGFSAKGAFFAAVAESYPDLTTNLNIFDKIADNVAGGRASFKNKQSKLLDKVRVYNTWRETGLINSFVIRNFLGFPSQRLEARVGGQVVAKGSDALDKIQQIVVTGSTVESFTSGRMEPLALPK